MTKRSTGLFLMAIVMVVWSLGGIPLARPNALVKAQFGTFAPRVSMEYSPPLSSVIQPQPLALEDKWSGTPTLPGPGVIWADQSRGNGLSASAQETPFAPTAVWRWHSAGEVTIPILLYHHLRQGDSTSRYVVSLQNFEAQMARLHRWGYTTISLSLLMQAITEGAELPPRPVVITFDDGYQEVYSLALPVLSRYGFTAVVFVVVGQIGVGKSLNADQIRHLAAAGWEIGSHSWTHTDLRRSGVDLNHEIKDSRLALEQLLGAPVTAFAFPYGITSPYITRLVQDAGYQVGLGLGGTYRHNEKRRYYLSRIEVQGGYDLEAFARLLPWGESESIVDGEGQPAK